MTSAPYEYRKIPLYLVDVPKRTIRFQRPEEIEALAKDIAVNGQLQPIIVVELDDGRFALDDGAKRVLALQSSKADEIDAHVTRLSWLTPEDRTIRGLMANLNRGTYTALEECEALFTLQQAYEARYPDARKGGDRKSQAAKNKGENQKEIFSFRSQAADAIGLSIRAINIAVAIFKGLSLATKERLRGTPFERKQSDLKALSEESEAIQSAALDLLLSDPPEAASLIEAISLAKGEKPDGAGDKAFNAVVDKWNRFGVAQKRIFVSTHRDEIVRLLKEEGAI